MSNNEREKLLTLANDTDFTLSALVALIESDTAIGDGTLVGIMNNVRRIKEQMYQLTNFTDSQLMGRGH